MDTERAIMLRGQNIKFSFAELNSVDVKLAREHVEITRHLQEIQQLYLMFQYAVDCIDGTYTLLRNGTVLKNNEIANSQADFIAINAMVNNLISAGRTLVESMDCYINENYPEGNSCRDEYFDFLHKTYDDSFAYRFLIRLRDYSQHGHLPVNEDAGWYGFDLYQVLNKPNFKQNGLIKQQLDNAVKECVDIYGDIPRLPLAMTLAEYTAQLLGIYHRFWAVVESAVIASENNFKALIANHPENVNIGKDASAPFFIYDICEDGLAHIVFVKDDAQKMLSIFKLEAKTVADQYMNSWHQLKFGTIMLRVRDKKQIEIGLL